MKEKQTLTRKGKVLSIIYVVLVAFFTLGLTPVHAEGDPLTVINNLSNFIFEIGRAHV